jgi:hypothetical protein
LLPNGSETCDVVFPASRARGIRSSVDYDALLGDFTAATLVHLGQLPWRVEWSDGAGGL